MSATEMVRQPCERPPPPLSSGLSLPGPHTCLRQQAPRNPSRPPGPKPAVPLPPLPMKLPWGVSEAFRQPAWKDRQEAGGGPRQEGLRLRPPENLVQIPFCPYLKSVALCGRVENSLEFPRTTPPRVDPKELKVGLRRPPARTSVCGAGLVTEARTGQPSSE